MALWELDTELQREPPMRRMQLMGVALSLLWVSGLGCDDRAAPSSAAPAPPQPSPSSSAAGLPRDAASDAPTAAVLAEQDELLSLEVRSEHQHHHLGFAGLVMMAVDTLGTSADQDVALDKIRGDFNKQVKPIGEANASLGNLLADGVAAGIVDKVKVDAAVARTISLASDTRGAMDDELNQLHDALRPEQRAALVDKLDAEWALWKETNALDQATDCTRPDGHLGHFAKELGLTDQQLTAARASIGASKDARVPFDTAPADAHLKAFSAAFVADKFDAKKVSMTPAENTRLVSWGVERNARFYEAIAPILTPPQRVQVADDLREHAAETQPEGTP